MFKRPYRKIIYRKKVKILLIRIVNRNLGDQVIAENAAYLVRQALPRLTRRHYVLHSYDIQSEDYELLRTADLIIFVGGGLIKYRQEDFHTYVPSILEFAAEHAIPVCFNCVGVEGYDASDARCLRLAETLNAGCVKVITVRDDLETLQRDYIKSDCIAVSAAIDPAVFTSEVYGITRQTHSKVIGLGIVRHRIFEDYGITHITKEFQLEMWKGVAKELEARGYRWQFYVNGLRSDYDFAIELLQYMGRESEASVLLAPRPVESRELVALTASYAGVIACRMHANIIAYALGIPSVGLVWNDKMVFWGERIGCPERFLTSERFEPRQIVQCLEDSMGAGCAPCPDKLKQSICRPLRQFVHRYGAAAWKKNRSVHLKKPLNWADRLVAVALGGIGMRYSNMNTPDGLEHACAHGFRIFEADIRLTKDGKPVCVNGWSKGSYEKLGVDPQQYTDGMDYAEFMKCKMYGSYETMDAQHLLEQMCGKEGDWKLILDIGKPSKAILADMIIRLHEICLPYMDRINLTEHLFIRLQSKYDVEAVQEAALPMQVMYYVPPKQVREEKKTTLDSIGKYCKKRGIQWVSLPKETLDEEVMAYLHKQKLKSCLFSFNRYTEICMAVQMGVDWIATSYLSIAEMEDWYESGYTIVIR
ncbi:hypothetical protein C823_003352 [Eubacterium plexicaudatum ASF492]|uniref:Polysaccharide pyruvyl transferase domain-containing protein n=1 Tax=Eubacterium plexicaudatum ASF492 TaxID=1235802 RepID=N2APH7_9FIRM|nr:hypothetical protein C823_003352 [Eubacterium plexicaudatum ASF492]